MTRDFGYIRVSSKDQNEDRQLIALHEVGVLDENIYLDKQSGKDFNRPAYKKMLRRLKKGDHLVVKSIDRLGRNYKDIMEQWRRISKEIGADITILDMPLLDTTNCKDLLGTFISDIVLQLLSFVAENERDNIRRRQAEGIAAAKARGIRFGQPVKQLPDNFPELYQLWKQSTLTIDQLAAQCAMARSTTYRRIRLYEQAMAAGSIDLFC
ncbi:MAG: recombinase family protein [Angelakisella sp.]